jgi:hypothetical protein
VPQGHAAAHELAIGVEVAVGVERLVQELHRGEAVVDDDERERRGRAIQAVENGEHVAVLPGEIDVVGEVAVWADAGAGRGAERFLEGWRDVHDPGRRVVEEEARRGPGACTYTLAREGRVVGGREDAATRDDERGAGLERREVAVVAA